MVCRTDRGHFDRDYAPGTGAEPGRILPLEVFYDRGPALARVEPFIIGRMAAAMCVALGFVLYAKRKYMSTIALCAATVFGLLIYKILAIG